MSLFTDFVAHTEGFKEGFRAGYEKAKKELEERKTGKWKHVHQWTWDCSECGYRVNAKYFKYCPNCGAKMEVDA